MAKLATHAGLNPFREWITGRAQSFVDGRRDATGGIGTLSGPLQSQLLARFLTRSRRTRIPSASLQHPRTDRGWAYGCRPDGGTHLGHRPSLRKAAWAAAAPMTAGSRAPSIPAGSRGDDL